MTDRGQSIIEQRRQNISYFMLACTSPQHINIRGRVVFIL